MKTISYVKGDATLPQMTGNRIIAHVCNDMGRWSKGFVLSISKRWLEPEKAYKQWHQRGDDFVLGEIQLVEVEKDIWVANMIAQHKIKPYEEIPIRYEAVAQCLEKLATFAKKYDATLHLPRIGCGLAGGEWEKVEALIIKHLCEKDLHVFVYDYE